MTPPSPLCLHCLRCPKPSQPWGTLGHTAVALLATSYLHNTTLHYSQQLLNDSSHLSLYSIATWADSYRYTPPGAFSAAYYYIDAFDDPNNATCNVDYARDCPPEGCIISAIANYTTPLTDEAISVEER